MIPLSIEENKMRLMKLYSNQENIFRTLVFNSGINAIIGTVREKSNYLDDDKKHTQNYRNST